MIYSISCVRRLKSSTHRLNPSTLVPTTPRLSRNRIESSRLPRQAAATPSHGGETEAFGGITCRLSCIQINRRPHPTTLLTCPGPSPSTHERNRVHIFIPHFSDLVTSPPCQQGHRSSIQKMMAQEPRTCGGLLTYLVHSHTCVPCHPAAYVTCKPVISSISTARFFHPRKQRLNPS